MTPAKSLLYECVNTLLSGEISSTATVRLCLDQLRTFVEDPDQNRAWCWAARRSVFASRCSWRAVLRAVKYLGLLGLHKLMKQHPRAVYEHKARCHALLHTPARASAAWVRIGGFTCEMGRQPCWHVVFMFRVVRAGSDPAVPRRRRRDHSHALA